MRTLLLIGLLSPLSVQAQSQQTYVLDSNRQVHDLKADTYVLVDSSGKLPEGAIISGKRDSLFQPFATAPDNPASSYWLRFSVHANTRFSKWWVLFKNDQPGNGYSTQNDDVKVYYTNSQHEIIKTERTGLLVPRSQKSFRAAAGFKAVLFSAAAGQFLSVYVKISNRVSESPRFSYPVIQDPSIPIEDSNFSGMMTIVIAVTICFCILSLFFFVFVKERSYLFFAFYVFFLSQHYLILRSDCPFIDLYIPEHPKLVVPAWNFLTLGSFILFSIFGRSFINLPKLSKQTDRWFTIFIISGASLVVTRLIWHLVSGVDLNPGFIQYLIPLGAFAFTIRFALFKNILARLYVAGALWLMAFTILGLLWNAGIVTLLFNPWAVAQMGQLVIYTAALAYKVRLNERARAQAIRVQQMDEIKSKFFANISHEFRTPLTLIQGPLQQIEEQVNDRQKQNEVATVPWRQIKTMRRNTDRLLELVNQLLDLSRLDSGKLKLQIIKGDVLQLLRMLAGSFDSVAERKQIHYHVHFPEQTNIAFFDKDKLEKIFTNLLSNAFKYTPEKGTVSVIVETEETRLRLSVEDTGPGISKKELDKIFDRFYQVEGTEDKGSGIGLALVKELVELYRGQISVGSEPGKGSRFRVSIPLDKNSFKENELIYGEWHAEETFVNRSVHEKEAPGARESFKTQLPLLLVVEDNSDLRQFICETVNKQYQVIEANNGKEGFEKAIAEIPDMIISDVMMPVMNGFTMTEKLKKDERTSHIPVILLTAKAGQQHKLEGLETGADDYLTKPFDARELFIRVQNLIDQRKLLRKKFAGDIQLRPSEITANSIDEIFLSNVMQAIEKNMSEEEFGVEELARTVTMSRSQLHRKLVALIDKPPSDLIRQTRLLRAKDLLSKKALTPSEVAYKVGFNSHTYFSKCFKEEFGISPSEI